MENNSRPDGKFGSMEGKDFYIVLFLCAAVVIASAWMLIAGAGTDVEDSKTVSVDISDAVVTMLPAGSRDDSANDIPVSAMDETEPVSEMEAAAEAAEETGATQSDATSSFVWPVWGSVDVPHSMEILRYDSTMADWRTHDGIDISCQLGDEVIAAADGTVLSVTKDDLYGTTVEIEHAGGIRAVYANLAEEPPVREGESVTMGQIIGSVGGTALAETNQVPHLHLSMMLNSECIDPLSILPERTDEE